MKNILRLFAYEKRFGTQVSKIFSNSPFFVATGQNDRKVTKGYPSFPILFSRQTQSFFPKFTVKAFLVDEAILKKERNCHVPFAPVRAFTVFAGPIPPELTADTLMTYMV